MDRGNWKQAKVYWILAVVIPAILHGAYDYIASTETSSGYFVGFIIGVFALSHHLVVRSSKQDRYI